MIWSDDTARALLRDCFDAAVASAHPAVVLADHLPSKPRGRCVVVGAGKASAAMAAALDEAWPDVALTGAVVAPHGTTYPQGRIDLMFAAHPVPDAGSMAAARHMLALVEGLDQDDLVIALLSGGASSLLALPAGAITLEQKQAINRALLRSGAPIAEMNAVRRALSAIKGGKLAAAAAPARLVTLAISDVPGDSPATIGSGPTVPDPTSPTQARAILARYGIAVPEAVAAHLAAAPAPARAAPPDYRLIATPQLALRAAAAVAEAAGLRTLILGDALQAEARELGRTLAGIALGATRHGTPLAPPCLILSGGEAGVTIPPGATPGQGGRNTECLLSLGLELDGAGGDPGIWALAADTDGIDGASDAAGAVFGPDSLARMRAAGVDPAALLDGHDSYRAFDLLGDLIRTGPTDTNVNDFRAILVA